MRPEHLQYVGCADPKVLPAPWKGFFKGLDGLLHEDLELHCVGDFVACYFYRFASSPARNASAMTKG